MKKFKTLDEQLAILHSRGLKITDYKASKQYLLTNNYYNIINGYSKYFMNNNNHYLPDATFDEISHLYFFEKEIKDLIFKFILEAENHIKYVVAYQFSKEYKDIPYAYLQTSSYSQDNILSIGYITSKFSKIIKDNTYSRHDNSIKHYVKKHKDVPIWVLVDYLTFGELYSFMKVLPPSLLNKIASNLCSFISEHTRITTPFTFTILLSFMDNIRDVRNRCAHGNKLLGYKYRSNLKYYVDVHKKYNIKNNSTKNDVYSVFIVLQCFLSKIQYAQLHNKLIKRFSRLERKLNSISVNNILNALGFPDNWHNETSILTH
ncbi:Abi family protein [Aerococcaceae bacterium DSM 111022]|nr:Abi family protein [Aerococcaceae bacterium DSM 111022]